MTTPIETLKARLSGIKKSGNGWSTRCPVHDDRTASLSITECEDGKVLLKCHAGCDTEGVLSAIGLTWADLFCWGALGSPELRVALSARLCCPAARPPEPCAAGQLASSPRYFGVSDFSRLHGLLCAVRSS